MPVPQRGGLGIRVDDAAEPAETEITEKAVKSAPPWLVSAIIHMVLVLLLVLLKLSMDEDQQVEIEVVYAETKGVQLEDALLETGLMEEIPIEEPVFSKDLMSVDDPFAAPPELDMSIDANTSLSTIEAPSIGMALTGREKGAKEALLGAYGGTAITEAAVQDGLAWLVRQQDMRSGLWSLEGPYADGGPYENQVAATAMALLALQGAGNTHKKGKYKRNVERGAAALVKMQDKDGNYVHEVTYHQRLYTQAQASIAIIELYGMTKDSRFRDPAQKSLLYAAKSQSPTLGGWRYEPRKDSDTSVTGWFVMALQSGKMADLQVQSPMLDAVSKFLDGVSDENIFYAYQRHGAPSLTMTAEALLCRQYLGWKRDNPQLRKGVDYLLENPVDYDEQNLYYWYYATQVLHHMGGEDWDRWNRVMRDAVPRHQKRDGMERGSWNPGGDEWGHMGGRLYTTCLSIYMLEVYYRHMPIYKHF